MDKINLTTSNYWDERWDRLTLPAVIEVNHIPGNCFDRVFKTYLPRDANLKLIELGCAPGKWLHYFNTMFGYQVYGVEYSPIGYNKTLENLAALRVKGQIANADVMAPPSFEPMDIVFSYGLVEHFGDTKNILEKHLLYAAKDGLVITILPNFGGFYGILQKMADEKVFAGHKIIGLEEIKRTMSELGIKEIYAGYNGIFNLGLVNWGRTPRVFTSLINIINSVTHKLLKLFGIRTETALFSPYFTFIGRKQES